MCAGALINSRIARLVYGAKDPRFGCAGSVYNITEDTRFNHRLVVDGGVLEEECAEIISNFFRAKRIKP
jgi:tRNA(adenine34) deaminase